MNKRVVVLHPAYWEQAMGGAELQIFYLVKHLKELGCEVHYIFEDKNKTYANNLKIQLHPLNSIKIKKRLGQRWFFYKTTINKKLASIKPDIIYTRLYSSWSGFATHYSLTNNCKHICAVASDNDLKSISCISLFLKPFNIVERYYMHKSFKKASYVLVQNSYQAKKMKEKFKRDGIKINQSTELVNEANIYKNSSPINILWVANFKSLKRPELYIQLVERLKDYSNVKFKMIGRLHNDYKSILNHANLNFKNFEYLGEISNIEVNEELLKAHILVNTSDYEGFSNTFVQAWMRKVVVLSMNSNPDEILTTKNIGFICPTVDVLVDKVKQLVKDKNLRQKMSQKAYSFAVVEHSLDQNLDKVINLIK